MNPADHLEGKKQLTWLLHDIVFTTYMKIKKLKKNITA